jgi:hypothetical protein
VVISFIKQPIRKDVDMTLNSTYENNHPVTPPQVVNVIDLGYLGAEKDSNNYQHYHIKRRKTKICSKKK